MELFTEIEFNSEELDGIDSVLYPLIEEGWKVYNELTISKERKSYEKKIMAKKFFLRRDIALRKNK